ncbi:hypothetical protein GOQ27_11295 [Clostridium sp. D2Q-11]|uniref:Lipoprotein n=1 Tax=Anaeromonas frigoriresistens TaxID=2683708 RepID=A0A942UWW5_9FIRM|nr:hypothetical protein [Anaeromonas frigoriresistens]MBS4539050.1 hypothetical protein [Anaeromonas frigoriresistens]
MKRKALIFFILALIILSSCSQQAEQPKTDEKKDKVSEELVKIQESNKTAIEDLEKIMEKVEEPIFVEVKDEADKKQEEESGGGETGGSEGQEQGQGQQPLIPPEEKTYEEKKEEENIKKQEEIEKMWMSLSTKVEGIHNSWNNFKITAIEEGVDTKSIATTDSALNSLTIAIGKKELMTSIKEGNKMTLSLANYFDVYKGNVQGDFNRITYTVTETYIQALEDNWDKAQSIALEYEEYFSRLRQKIELEKKDEKLLDTLEISIRDLISSLKYKDADLVKIKRGVVLTNIERVNEAAK